MKVINVMNFVRFIDERMENSTEVLYNTTRDQLALVNEFGIENTFLLQYDAFDDERFSRLFKENATEKTELGVWFEIVKPMTDRCRLPYRSECGWQWDWHIIPGFSMAYTPKEREMLLDATMERFKEVFGYYPKTFASWLIDTHTLNYLAKKYDISAVAICRDQVNTDAYTLIGGYFNQAYYPSKNNIFTLYDMAMTGLVNHTKLPLRLAIFSGFLIGIFSVLIAFAYLVAKLIWWDTFNLGLAPLVVGMFFIGAVQLFFIGIIGEYIGAIYTQVKNKPLVIVEEKLNFSDSQE